MARIREVWAPNLEAEMRIIRDLVETYPYIAMDTEFPGVVARPIGTFKTSSDYHYQTMRCNVDLLKIVQLGLTLANDEGQLPQECSTWQFNFKFSLTDDMYTPDSIEQLQKAGIDFQRHEEIGISPNDFAELMITSGLVLTHDTRWISFHSGYDFGYFVKLLTAQSLPAMEDAFFDVLKLWFPTVYDIKYLMKATKVLKGGLQEVADDLGVMRVGPSQQAGSDSLLTASTFFKMREIYFDDRISDDEYSGKLYGLGQTFSTTNGFTTDPSRGGATIAERDDRGLGREVHNQTPVNGGGLSGVSAGAVAGTAGMVSVSGGGGGVTSQQTQSVQMVGGGGAGGAGGAGGGVLNSLQAAMATNITTPGYGPLSNGPAPYLRTMVGGGGTGTGGAGGR